MNIHQLTNIPFITETHNSYQNTFGRIFGQFSARIFGPKPVSVTHCWLYICNYVNILTSTIVTHRLNTACAWAEASPASKGHWPAPASGDAPWHWTWRRLGGCGLKISESYSKWSYCGVSYFPAVRIRIFVIGLIMHRPHVIPHVIPLSISCQIILNSRHE